MLKYLLVAMATVLVACASDESRRADGGQVTTTASSDGVATQALTAEEIGSRVWVYSTAEVSDAEWSPDFEQFELRVLDRPDLARRYWLEVNIGCKLFTSARGTDQLSHHPGTLGSDLLLCGAEDDERAVDRAFVDADLDFTSDQLVVTNGTSRLIFTPQR